MKHGGISYKRGDNSWHLCIHCHVDSMLHKRRTNYLEMDDPIYLPEQHMYLLDTEPALNILAHKLNAYVSLATYAAGEAEKDEAGGEGEVKVQDLERGEKMITEAVVGLLQAKERLMKLKDQKIGGKRKGRKAARTG